MTTLSDILKMGAEDIGQLTNNQLKRILVEAEKETRRRVNIISRAGRYSWAAKSYFDVDTIRENWDERYPSKTNYADKKRNFLIAKLQAYYGFLNAQSSTVKGIREVDRQQDIRLFGSYTRGGREVAKHRMTDEERVKFWELYNEFIKSNPAAFSQWGSSTVVQTTFYDVMVKSEWGTITELLQAAQERLDADKAKNHTDGGRYVLGTDLGRNSR